MKCPCRGCEKVGCGSYHDQCAAYQEWKKYMADTHQWIQNMAPVTSPNGVKQRNENLRRGKTKARKWNVKQQYGKEGS